MYIHAGFDAAAGDPVGSYKVTPGVFGLMIKVIGEVAIFTCDTIHTGAEEIHGRQESHPQPRGRIPDCSNQGLCAAVCSSPPGLPFGRAEVSFFTDLSSCSLDLLN